MRHPKRSAVKVIDFGSSCYNNDKMFKYIQSRFYRAPEVILELEYSFPIDMWSLGCMMVELYNGEPLFPGEDETDQLQKIIEVFGYPNVQMINSSPKALKFFTKGLKGEAIFKKFKNSSPTRKNFNEILKFSQKNKSDPNEFTHFMNFRNLVIKMLKIDPSHRINPLEALNHEFFSFSSTEFPPPKETIQREKLSKSSETNKLLNGKRDTMMDTSLSPHLKN